MRVSPSSVVAAVLAVVLAVAVAGCAGAERAGPVTSTSSAVSLAPSSSSPAAPLPVLDWERSERLDLGGDLAIESCGGDAPVRCLVEGGRVVGQLELASFPVESFTFLDAPVAAGFADGSCVAAEGPQLDPVTLDEVVPLLGQVAATMRLPEEA